LKNLLNECKINTTTLKFCPKSMPHPHPHPTPQFSTVCKERFPYNFYHRFILKSVEYSSYSSWQFHYKVASTRDRFWDVTCVLKRIFLFILKKTDLLWYYWQKYRNVGVGRGQININVNVSRIGSRFQSKKLAF
jgi:hypothetical protein